MPEDGDKDIPEGDEHEHGDYDRHKALVHVGYAVGASTLTGLVDYLSLWPESHLWALLVGAAWLSIVAVVEMRVWGHTPQQISMAVVALFAAAVAIFWIVGPVRIPEHVTSGTLQTGNEPVPSDEPCPNTPADTVRVLIGDLELVPMQPGKFTALKVGQCDVLAMERLPNGDVAVDASLYDATGKLVARMKNGQFDAIEGEKSTIKRGGDLATFAIKDGRGDELLYMHRLNENTLRARGTFGCPGHAPVVVRDDEPIPTIFFHHSCFRGGGAASIWVR